MKTLGSVSGVVAAIREDAAADVDRIVRQSAVDAASPADPDEPTLPELDVRAVDARRRALEEASEAEWESSLEDLQGRERWIEAVVQQGRRAIAADTESPRVRSWIRALVVEAASHLPPGPCLVIVAPAVRGLLDEAWCSAVAGVVGRRVDVEPGDLSGGCIVRAADASIAYDNSIEARERRTAVRWRAALARLYADAVAGANGAADAAHADATAEAV